jgi:transposase-like protein
VNISTIARLFGLKIKTLYYWYKEYLSDYRSDIKSKKWCSEKIEVIDKKTGEIKEKPVYVLKAEHL